MNCNRIGALAARGTLAIVALWVVGGCSKAPEPPKDTVQAAASAPNESPASQSCVDASVVYYYRYKDGAPDESDIAFVEPAPPANRCVTVSKKTPPAFPDEAVAGKMKVDKPLSSTAQISSGVATIAVYYKLEGSPPTSHTLLAVEDLTNVQGRSIGTASVFLPGATSPGCGNCPEFRCGGGTCCKRPPCP